MAKQIHPKELSEQALVILSAWRIELQLTKTYSMVVSLLGDVAVAIAPVKCHFLLLFLIQPDELLSGLGHKVMQALQVALSLSGTALRGADIQKVRLQEAVVESN